jgi:Ca2+/H+ antiporter, TMEM165/GDT1 family
VDPVVIVIVFGVIAVAELPDKTMFASLALATRFPALWVWSGAAAAFLVHVCIAVTAGGFLTLLPHRLVEGIVAVLFLAGAAFLLLGKEEQTEAEGEEAGEEAANRMAAGTAPSSRRVAATSFGVIFAGEWGDITQIATANYAARYHDPVSVGIGALLGLWAAAAIAVTVGSRLLDYVPVRIVRRVTGLILLAFAGLSAYEALR